MDWNSGSGMERNPASLLSYQMVKTGGRMKRWGMGIKSSSFDMPRDRG